MYYHVRSKEENTKLRYNYSYKLSNACMVRLELSFSYPSGDEDDVGFNFLVLAVKESLSFFSSITLSSLFDFL